MKKQLFIISFIFSIIHTLYGQPAYYYNLTKTNSLNTVSNIKNPRFIDTRNYYDAFGFVERTGVNRATYFRRIGATHLTGGNAYMSNYYINSDLWADTICIDRGTPDVRDIWGGRLDNDSIVLFMGRSLNGIGGSSPSNWSIDLYMMRGDTNGNFGSHIPFNFGSYPQLQRCYFFGHTAKGAAPGEYYIELYEVNVDTGNLSHKIIACVATTDYFRTYSIHTIIDATGFAASEGTLAYLGNGKMNLMLRREQSGDLDVFESTNSGVTWTYRNRSNLYWYVDGNDVIPYTFMDTTKNKFTVLTNDRGSDFIEISRDNDTSLFGSSFPVYASPKLYYYNQSEDHLAANTSLGYPSMINIIGDSVFLLVWSHETTSTMANAVYSRDNFATNTTIPASPPTITPSFITATTFRIDIDGYTQSQLNNIDYLQFDLSTNPAFGSFVTAKYRNVSAFPAVSLHDIYMNAIWDNFSELTTGTTYYIRIKACNSLGCSSYTTQTITTL